MYFCTSEFERLVGVEDVCRVKREAKPSKRLLFQVVVVRGFATKRTDQLVICDDYTMQYIYIYMCVYMYDIGVMCKKKFCM